MMEVHRGKNDAPKPGEKVLQNKKLAAKLKIEEEKFAKAEALQDEYENVMSQFFTGGEETGLFPENEMEKTHEITQNELRQAGIDMQTQTKMFDLKLDNGPYKLNFSPNGRSLMLGGRKGHIAVLDWVSKKLKAEFEVNDEVKDTTFIQGEDLLAVAQRKYVYIYDKTGAEIHRLFRHLHPYALEYLNYHFLLCSIGRSGVLKYQDITTGEIAAELKTKAGPCGVITQNPTNGVTLLGHRDGVVSMWTPNTSKAVVKILANKGAIHGLGVDATGKYLASVGGDSRLRIYDLRNDYKEVHSYRAPNAKVVSMSQNGMIAVGGSGSKVVIWRNALSENQREPYMTVQRAGFKVEDASFCPFEDILGIGYDRGYRSALIPGAGYSSFDSFEQNPYMTGKLRREARVKQLLEKIPSEMISLDNEEVGSVDSLSEQVRRQYAKEEYEERYQGEKYENFELQEKKKKLMGKSKGIKRYKRKQANVVTTGRELKRNKLRDSKNEMDSGNTGINAKRREEYVDKVGIPSLKRLVQKELD